MYNFFLMITTLFITFQAHADLEKKIQRYIESSDVIKTMQTLRNNVLPRSKGLCAKFVRLGFMSSGLIQTHPGINYAKNYTPYFDRNGWTNLLNKKVTKDWNIKLNASLFNTPRGCAIVYDSLDTRNDRNAHIGHIETRIKDSNNKLRWGFISDYFSPNPRTGLICKNRGKKIKRLKVFTARSGSPHYKNGKKVKRYITVTTCKEYSKSASTIGDEWVNRKAIGAHCKL